MAVVELWWRVVVGVGVGSGGGCVVSHGGGKLWCLGYGSKW